MQGLLDRHGRVATDLRVSLTDRCNLRCNYCMPAEGLDWLPTPEVLTDDEVCRLIRVAVEQLGITEVRFTGGEPLLRRGLVDIISRTTALNPRPETSLTTNALGLARIAPALVTAGLDRVNVSLDTIRPEDFERITLRDRLSDVLAGLEAAQLSGLGPVKVNAVLLRGSSSAASSNAAIVTSLRAAVEGAGLPADAIQLLTSDSHDSVKALMRARGLVDVLIPRGGAGLINAVVTESSVPVIETGVGNCHVYVDQHADLDMAERIVLNAKTHRTSVCNSAESLLVHEAIAGEFVPRITKVLQDAGVLVHGDPTFADQEGVLPASEADHAAEYLGLEMSAAVVPDLDAALEHIRRYSSHHTDAIVTESQRAAQRFIAEVDSAAVLVNASTRFTDGGEFGFGAEIGISTQKLHARGPMGLQEMTTTKYVVTGDGHVR